jgi:hypothetical protein
MSKPKSPKPRPGEQVVFRVPAATKAMLFKTAKDLGISANAAACERLLTGKWPQPRKGD